MVHGLRCSATAGDPAVTSIPAVAVGEFIIVDMTVKNVSAELQTYFTESQMLVIDGKQHSPDQLGAVYLDPESESAINPGLAIDIEVPFDVPVGAVPEAIVLDGDLTPGGVTVDLTGARIATS